MTNGPSNIDLRAIKICEDKRLPQQLWLEAAELAIAETPENSPSGAVEAARLMGIDTAALETFGAVITGKKWKNGRVLRVRHLDGDPDIHAKVESEAKKWESYANISFSFVEDDDAEIRISYHLDNKSWSYLGTEALAIPDGEETMHYGWLLPDTTEESVRRVVVHEFGHALGMIHEHQHPTANIQWDKPVVYRYYMEELGWSKADVDNNLFAREAAHATQFDKYDPLSIMHYPVPPEFTTNNVEVGWNTDFSNTDKRFIARVYPKAAPADMPQPQADMSGGGAPKPAGLSAAAAAAVGRQRLQKRWGG